MFNVGIFVLVVFNAILARANEFKIPEATLEFLSPRGLKISLPDWDEDVSLVAFHVSVNQEFYGVEAGQWAVDVRKKRNGRWSHTIPELRARRGDTVYYWVYAIRNGLGYQNLDLSYTVKNENPHTTKEQSSGSVPPTVATTVAPTPAPAPVGEVVDWRGPGADYCTKSDSSVSMTEGSQFPCSGSQVFNTSFRSSADMASWKHQVYVGAGDSEDAFTVFMSDRNVSQVVNNSLTIKPYLLEQKYSVDFVSTGTLTLNDCTEVSQSLCSGEGVAYLILPPVVSARLSTKNQFSFRYGIVEIKAKLPKGDFIVPELWLEDKNSVYGGRNTVQMVLGVTKHQGQNLLVEAGLEAQTNTMFHISQPLTWLDTFHIFKLVWSPDSLIFSVDSQELGKIDISDKQIFPSANRENYLTLGVHVGGLRDFPDSPKNTTETKPWKNSDPKARLKFWQARDSWYNTWNEDSALRVEYVKVTAL